ncbi:MAG: hypothetical protein KDB80_10170 [Planctomycetes bacterium]|nr:hypothetical protein [Planctomycetota bacterium]
MKTQSLTIALATTLFASAAFAQMPEPASLLLYPVVRSDQSTISIISVTNTNPNPGASTNVRFVYNTTIPNPGDPFNPLGCTQFDRREFLTPADTVSVSMLCHTAMFSAEGYLVVTAQNPNFFNQDWSFNHLAGSIIHIDGATNLTFSTNAIPFRSLLDFQTPTDVNQNGRSDLDGVEYESVRDYVILDHALGLINPSINLVNLTGGPNDKNTVSIVAWNDNEFPLSVVKTFTCWFDERASTISPIFTDAFLVTTPNDPSELDLLCIGSSFTEPYWIRFDSIRVEDPAGNIVSNDGALAGMVSGCPGGRVYWMDGPLQLNGSFPNGNVKVPF